MARQWFCFFYSPFVALFFFFFLFFWGLIFLVWFENRGAIFLVFAHEVFNEALHMAFPWLLYKILNTCGQKSQCIFNQYFLNIIDWYNKNCHLQNINKHHFYSNVLYFLFMILVFLVKYIWMNNGWKKNKFISKIVQEDISHEYRGGAQNRTCWT